MDLFISEEEEKKRNLIHYEGELGVFDYDPIEFRLEKLDDCDYLHYHGNGKSVDLPDGCINTIRLNSIARAMSSCRWYYYKLYRM